jgi:hypothetical protein
MISKASSYMLGIAHEQGIGLAPSSGAFKQYLIDWASQKQGLASRQWCPDCFHWFFLMR